MNAWPHWNAFIDALRPWQAGGWIEPEGGGLAVCHRPQVAPMAYLHLVYPPLSEAAIDAADEHYSRPIPAAYRAFLGCANGCRLFEGFDLGGSLLQNDGAEHIDRSLANVLGHPISLSYGNSVERPSGLSETVLIIGGMTGWNARGALAMTQAGDVALVHPDDGHDVAVRWPSLEAMLLSEIERRGAMFDAAGVRLASPQELMPPEARRWETPKQAPARQSWLAKLLRKP
jgi:hypothetical protein